MFRCSNVSNGSSWVFAVLLAWGGLSIGMATAEEEDATLFPIPDYSADFLSSPALSGDWGGARAWLAEHGIQIRADLNQFYQDIFSGGVDERREPAVLHKKGTASRRHTHRLRRLMSTALDDVCVSECLSEKSESKLWM